MLLRFDAETLATKKQAEIDARFYMVLLDISELKEFFLENHNKLSKETIFRAARLVIEQDKVEQLKLFYENHDLTLFDEELLGSTVVHNAKECFAYLNQQRQISVDLLRSFDIYEAAQKMQQELEEAGSTLGPHSQLTQRRIATAKQRLETNPADAAALYDLALSNFLGIKNSLYKGMGADQLFEVAAKLGHAGACYELTRKYLQINPDLARDYADFGLADTADHTRFDTPDYKQKDLREQLRGLRSVINIVEPDPDSLYELGVSYDFGNNGRPYNPDMALQCMRRAASLGHKEAQIYVRRKADIEAGEAAAKRDANPFYLQHNKCVLRPPSPI